MGNWYQSYKVINLNQTSREVFPFISNVTYVTSVFRGTPPVSKNQVDCKVLFKEVLVVAAKVQIHFRQPVSIRSRTRFIDVGEVGSDSSLDTIHCS